MTIYAVLLHFAKYRILHIKVEGGGLSQSGQCPYSYFFNMASLTPHHLPPLSSKICPKYIFIDLLPLRRMMSLKDSPLELHIQILSCAPMSIYSNHLEVDSSPLVIYSYCLPF